ncbi:hypothetical protein HZB60_00125 [candidate division KSB1 bacterium]|nr:hypothetical protein [candidate division KSB1 bacterium]
MQRDPNIIDKMMRYMPGYTGYAERDERRQSDAQVRARVCAALEQCEEIVRERLQLELDRHQEIRAQMAENCRQRIQTLRERLHHAPAGASGLMACDTIGTAELEELTRRDLELLESAIRLAERVAELTWQDLTTVIHRLEHCVDARGHYLQEFK